MSDVPSKAGSRCTVVSTDFVLMGKLQEGGSMEVGRVMSGLRPGLAPEGEEEVLVIDLACEEDASVEDFLSAGSDFPVTVLLVPDAESAGRWQNRGAVVISAAEWIGGEGPSPAEAGEGQPRRPRSPDRRTPPRQTVVLFSPKGGVGRTTLAVNLAVRARAGLGLETVIVDLDIGGGDVALHLDLTEEPTVVDLAAYGEDVTADLLREFAATYRPSGLSVLPAPGRPELVELAPWERLAPVVRSCQRIYDLVVVDTPGDPASEMSYRVLEEATYVLAPVTLDVSAARRLKTALNMMSELSADLPDKVRLVVNRQAEGSPITCRDVEEFIGLEAVVRFPDCSRAAVEAVGSGKPLVLGGGDDSMQQAVDDILENIFSLRVPEDRVSFLTRMLGYVRAWPGRRG